jgi:uncharacterized protein (TIGR02996 family)
MPRPLRPTLMALLADVKQNPDDLTPWLVLCDWLEEQDDEADRARGEYCRLCFDKLGQKTYASDWDRGERRRELYRKYHQAWLGPIKTLEPQIHKGLLRINRFAVSFQEIVPIASSDEERWAWVGYLTIFETVSDFTDGRLSAVFGGLHTLEIARLLPAKTVVQLAQCPFVARLGELSFSVRSLSESTATRLATSPNLAGLSRLHVKLCRTIQQEDRDEQAELAPEAETILRQRYGEGLRIVRS